MLTARPADEAGSLALRTARLNSQRTMDHLSTILLSPAHTVGRDFMR